MRVLVCGSREFDDLQLFMESLNDLSDKYDFDNNQPITIIEGGAKGADFLGRVWAKYCAFEHLPFPADWKAYGKAAGPIRNKQMLDEGKPDLVIAFLAKDSKGTKNMIEQAQAKGIKTEIIEI
jgi:hypothetical protein